MIVMTYRPTSNPMPCRLFIYRATHYIISDAIIIIIIIIDTTHISKASSEPNYQVPKVGQCTDSLIKNILLQGRAHRILWQTN